MIRLTKKKVLIIGMSTLALLMLASAGLFWWVTTVKARFETQVQTFKTSTADELKTFDSQFAALRQTGPNTAILGKLAEVEQKSAQLLEDVPQEPRVLWVNVVSQQAKDNANAMRQWLFDLNHAATEAKVFIAYKSEVAGIIASLAGGTGRDSTEQQSLATQWQEASLRLKTMVPPQKATSLHAELTNSIETIGATLATLPDLYNKKDYTGFVAKQKELDSKIAGLKSLHESFKTLNTQYDQAIGLQLKALK